MCIHICELVYLHLSPYSIYLLDVHTGEKPYGCQVWKRFHKEGSIEESYVCSLCELVDLHLNSYPASHDFPHLLITFANSSDPDQGQHNFGPYLDPNYLTL